LGEAEDENEELMALMLLALTVQKPLSNRFGLQGRYNTRKKSQGFVDMLLDDFSARMFKSFCQ
jgi:hypothetical protein